MRGLLAIALAAPLAACSPSDGGASDPPASYPESLLTADQRHTSALTSRWLVGHWDHDPECRSGAGTSLRPDGRYTMNDGYGRWSLSGDSLRIVQEKRPSVQLFQARVGDAGRSRIRIVGPKTISVHWPGGGTAPFHHCDPKQLRKGLSGRR